jgi:hypothetical protein
MEKLKYRVIDLFTPVGPPVFMVSLIAVLIAMIVLIWVR